MEIVNRIMILYNEIKSIYFKLYKLEKDNEKENELSLLLVDLLKKKIKQEVLLIRELFDYNNDDIYDVYNLLEDSDIRKRLMDSINLFECLNGDNGLSGKEKIEQMRLDRLYIECYRNMNLIYYSFLQEYIELDMFLGIRDSLLNFKYNNSFVNHDIESQLVSNNFNVPKVNYVILNLVVDALRIENNEMMLDCFAERILTSISDILCIKDSDYNNDKNIVLSINNQCILRAGLVMINDNDYSRLTDEIDDIITRNNNTDNIISMEIVNSILVNRNKDKERVKRLSFRPLYD